MELKQFLEFISDSAYKISSDVEKLFTGRNNYILNDLRKEILILERYINNFAGSEEPDRRDTAYLQQSQPVSVEIRSFSQEELSRFNGINGNPAYIAVHGDIYDVTNVAGWAGARHFDLNAGSDVTEAYELCHAGSDILSRLTIVGKLI